MPIYEYRCSSCGVKKEHLQKISDARLTVCPDCGKPTYEKQLTAAGFQLKGSGWYVTDFKGGASTAAAPVKKDEGAPVGGDAGAKDGTAGATTPATSTPSTTATPAATTSTPAGGT